jgi:hypothetical protein
MDKKVIYEYDRRNRDAFTPIIEANSGCIVTWAFFSKKDNNYQFPQGTKSLYIDISSLFHSEERAEMVISVLEALFNVTCNVVEICYIVESQYAKTLSDYLYYRVHGIESLEEKIGIELDEINNIVDINNEKFNTIMSNFSNQLFGNQIFKDRFKEELIKYRFFNRIGCQPIFSVLICGASGIGKTEVARILHRELSPNEPVIKINFGNYSTQDALNSLIGSPRGYIGSSKGELTDKLQNSKSKVILIDEFEKAGKPVYNFFLQMLEDGRFTDSLGREYDLNKYIIVFTSNMAKENIGQYIPPELRSRFSCKFSFGLLSKTEKEAYIEYKLKQYSEQIMKEYRNISENDLEGIISIDVSKYQNIRDINNEIMRQLANSLYDKIAGNNCETS